MDYIIAEMLLMYELANFTDNTKVGVDIYKAFMLLGERIIKQAELYYTGNQ